MIAQTGSGGVRRLNDLTTREAALEYAGLDWHVIPLWWVLDEEDERGRLCACPLGAACTNRGKHPLTPHGHNDASNDLAQVEDWWKQWPEANVGVHCQRSGFLALDVDQDKVLPDDWPPFTSGEHAPPQTLIQRSGSSRPGHEAHHVLYSTRSLEGARVRGKVQAAGTPGVHGTLIKHNGYIVVAPSMHAAGRPYQWITDNPIADPGDIIGPLVSQDTGGGSARDRNSAFGGVSQVTSFSDLVQIAVDRAEEGEARSDTGEWLACQLRDNGCAAIDAERVWLPTYYREVVGFRPDPPDVDIIRRWIRSAYSAPAREPLPGFDPRVRAVMARDALTGTPVTGDGGNGNGNGNGSGPVHVNELEAAFAGNENASDLGNSRRFVRLMGDIAKFAADLNRWYVWDGSRWKPDIENSVMSLTTDVIDNIRQTGEAETEVEARREWGRWAHQSEAYPRRVAMIKGAESDPRVVVSADVFDADPMLLVVKNGTIDLRTRELRTSRPDDLNSLMANVVYDPDAQCPMWKRHVWFVSNEQPEIAHYLWRAVGYSITGLISERALFFLQGDGSNGKNAFIEPIMQMMGSYARTSSEGLLTGGGEQHPTIIADLLGARLVFVDETRAGRRLNSERIKSMTGSRRIKGRFMRQDFFEFDVHFKLWIAGNGKPVVQDPSDGVWKRLHEVPCLGKVTPQMQIRDYGELMFNEEASGILNWALNGLAEWQHLEGLHKPESIEAAIAEHRAEEDFFGQFVDECLEITGDQYDWLTSDNVYGEYVRWCQSQLMRHVETKIGFGKLLGKLDGIIMGGKKERIDRVEKRVVRGVKWGSGASQGAIIAESYDRS